MNQIELEANCKKFSESDKKAGEVVRLVDGKLSSKEISDKLKINYSKVSSILRLGYKLDLLIKVESKRGVYKKKSGILAHIQKTKSCSKKSLEENVKIVSKYIKRSLNSISTIPKTELSQMAIAYSYLYAAEKLIRKVIFDSLSNEPNWTVTCFPNDVKKNIAEMKLKERYDSIKKQGDLEYTNLGDLKKIVDMNKNWDLIKNKIPEKDKSRVSNAFQDVLPLRNAIAHSIKLKKQDFKNADVFFTKLIKMFDQSGGL